VLILFGSRERSPANSVFSHPGLQGHVAHANVGSVKVVIKAVFVSSAQVRTQLWPQSEFLNMQGELAESTESRFRVSLQSLQVPSDRAGLV